MRKRIILSFLILSFFLLLISCGIPTIFTFSDTNDVLSISNNGQRLRFSKDSDEFTGHLMFLYLLTDNATNISSIQSSLVTSFNSRYVKNGYDSINITNKGTSAVASCTYQSNTYNLYQLHINTDAQENFNNNGRNWATSYMFTLEEGDYSIDYNLNEDNNLVITIRDYSTGIDKACAVTVRCNGSTFSSFEDASSIDYTAENTSLMTLYVLPAIVITSSEYNNKYLYCSSSFATLDV